MRARAALAFALAGAALLLAGAALYVSATCGAKVTRTDGGSAQCVAALDAEAFLPLAAAGMGTAGLALRKPGWPLVLGVLALPLGGMLLDPWLLAAGALLAGAGAAALA